SIFPHGHQGDERVQTRTPPPWTLTVEAEPDRHLCRSFAVCGCLARATALSRIRSSTPAAPGVSLTSLPGATSRSLVSAPLTTRSRLERVPAPTAARSGPNGPARPRRSSMSARLDDRCQSWSGHGLLPVGPHTVVHSLWKTRSSPALASYRERMWPSSLTASFAQNEQVLVGRGAHRQPFLLAPPGFQHLEERRPVHQPAIA